MSGNRWCVCLSQVYRMAAEDIGCSLAEAAEAAPYDAYLADAQASEGPALHVVYINTSLRTKANAHVRVSTITCTSSNVVQTILQAFAQVSQPRHFNSSTHIHHPFKIARQHVACLVHESVMEVVQYSVHCNLSDDDGVC